MTKKLSLLFTLSVMLLLFSGCVEREISISPQSGLNAWGEETNVNDIDISDLDQNLTESETMITEDMDTEKMERIAFPTSEYYRLARTGKGTVKGSIYVKDAYDKKIMGAGTRLYLNPATSYSDQWFRESYLGGYKMEKADSRLFNYLRFTAANSDGKFAFYGVPSGSYYLIGTVKCGTECGYDTPKNIRIATKVSVYGNKIVEKDLNRFVD
ncbi:carboxypeptidase regulatory-like domain-containing protein [Sulfurovum sp. CS9]|uniref:carboxypeptidase regulatory-like domain-containing protein n=1 Tax=Sulfurovum sp. CS9 TaxID=3391146 RepID=UPI0039EAD354